MTTTRPRLPAPDYIGGRWTPKTTMMLLPEDARALAAEGRLRMRATSASWLTDFDSVMVLVVSEDELYPIDPAQFPGSIGPR